MEDKNRRLNDKMNEIIFNKASMYKQKTIESLKRGGAGSPTRNLDPSILVNDSDKVQYYSEFIASANQRVKSAMDVARGLSRSPNREDRLAHLNVYRELERFELSNHKSPMQVPLSMLPDHTPIKNHSPLR